MATENLTSGWVFRPPLPSKWMVNTYSYHAQCFRVLTYIHLRIIWLFHGYQVCMYAKETWFVFLSQLSLREWDINDWLIFNQSNYYYLREIWPAIALPYVPNMEQKTLAKSKHWLHHLPDSMFQLPIPLTKAFQDHVTGHKTHHLVRPGIYSIRWQHNTEHQPWV